jgi:hypothetical protein
MSVGACFNVPSMNLLRIVPMGGISTCWLLALSLTLLPMLVASARDNYLIRPRGGFQDTREIGSNRV